MSIQTTPKQALEQWQAYIRTVHTIAKRVDDAMHERGWNLAASVGIGRCPCSLHNASIDDGMTGWCKDNPQRLKVAKTANYYVNQWPGSRLAERIAKRSWNRMLAEPFGWARYTLDYTNP